MIRIDAGALSRAVEEIFTRAGCTREEAAALGRRLVDSNLAGHDSHGVVRVPFYLDLLKSGAIVSGAHAKVVFDSPAMAVVDGQRGFGQVIGAEATSIAIDKARKNGVGVVALRHSGHLGRIGDWTEQCAEAGFASVHFVNVIGGTALVAPFGGGDARFGTNPVSAGMPRQDGRHLILDFATSKLAEGKIKVAFNKGAELPDGALIDAKGRPTRNPADLYAAPRGAMLPMGEHKGYGLAVFCDLLAGLISGGGTSHGKRLGTGRVLNNMLSIVLNPSPQGGMAGGMAGEAAGEGGGVAAEMETFIKWLTDSPPAEPGKPVLLPGDPERANRAERRKSGVPLDDTTWGNIVKAGMELGMKREEMEEKARRAN